MNKYQTVASERCCLGGVTCIRRQVAKIDDGRTFTNYYVVVPTVYGEKEVSIPVYHAPRDAIVLTMLIDDALRKE